jgi:hypothetical protein
MNHLPLARRTQMIGALVEGQNLSCKRIQCDEIWSNVKVKQAHIAKGTPRAHRRSVDLCCL